jgi:Ca-activated chloride channel homolog
LLYNHAMARSGSYVARLAIALLLCTVCRAFQTADIRVDSSLVLIPAHVTTPFGTSITTLSKKDFRIFEDEAPREITYFAKEDAPLSIGLLFDASGSMRNKIRQAAEAAAAFFKTANPQDEFFLVEFSDKPKLTVSFTPDSDEIYDRIAHAKPFGRTSLLDAIHLALGHMKNARNPRRAIVIVSDGGDNCSRHTAREIKNALLESDAQLYAMGIFDPEETGRHTKEERNGPQLLDELAEQSGGWDYHVDNLADLPSISARISAELREQYVIGYPPSDTARDGKFHRVKLVVEAPPETAALRTYYRHGYYAPIQ